MAAVAVLVACIPASAASALTSDGVFEAAKPAVVIVETDNAVTWSVPQPSLTAAKAQQLRNAVVAMVRTGQVANNESAIGQASVRLIVDNPGAWFTQGSQRHQQTDSVVALGTGFFVTEDGFLLTNDHVVLATVDDLRQQLIDQLPRLGSDPTQVAAFREEMASGLGVPVTDAQASRLFQWMLGVFKADLRVSSVTPTSRIGFGTMSPAAVKAEGLPVQVVAHGQNTPGRDVAVLKAAGGQFVSLATVSSTPGRGRSLTVIGYPCLCGNGSGFDPVRPLRPILTSGTAREQLPMSGGWDALGTDAAIEHGNSGGPVLDDSGRVVGLATFSATSAGGTPQSFAVPISVALQFTDQAHVRPAQGALGQKYAQAIAEYRQDHFQNALPLFQEVASASTHDPYASQYVALSQRAIASGRDRTPPLMGALPAIAVTVYVVVSAVAVGVGVFVYRRRRRLVRGW
ncbi:MAG TPA: serine protease [Candidatus Dormibacteraeota bacterium]